MFGKSCFMILCTMTGSACMEKESKPTNETSDAEPSDSAVVSEPAEEASFAYITQSISGSAIVVIGDSFEGTETFSLGVNDTAGTENLQSELIWRSMGSPIDTPLDCMECIFAFDLTLTFDAAASTDPRGEGGDDAFSYALGTNSYGENALFYGSDGQWVPWLIDGNTQEDLAETSHVNVVRFDGTNFTYSDGLVDFYYYH